MPKKDKSNYFDKFIDDQLKRGQQNRLRMERHQVKPEQDKKRDLLRTYRERAAHLVRWKKNV